MRRPLRWVAAGICAVAATVLAVFLTTNADAGDQRTVKYLGRAFTVPAGWQVVDLKANPHACVRFDRHALYLGTPSADQDCPAHAVGRTEAVLVQPASGASGSTDDGVARQITAGANGVTVTATYGRDHGLATRIVRGAGFGTPRAAAPVRPAPGGAARRAAGPGTAAPGAATPGGATPDAATPGGATPDAATPSANPSTILLSATNYTGNGFDACTAPSATAMNAWLSSPYRAVGIYIGGGDRACGQANLTASWVAQQASAGWHFLPLYVGPQAAFGELTSPTSQGTAAADDAYAQARALGFGPDTPLYYDMEGYTADQTANALAFESAWTAELHALGCTSGYYSSSGSGIANLVSVASAGTYQLPDVVDIARWNGMADTNDPNVPATLWTNQHRVHQYSGGHDETYSGVTINIDQDYLDVSIVAPSPLPRMPGGPTGAPTMPRLPAPTGAPPMPRR